MATTAGEAATLTAGVGTPRSETHLRIAFAIMVLAFVLAVSLGTGILFGLAPALRAKLIRAALGDDAGILGAARSGFDQISVFD